MLKTEIIQSRNEMVDIITGASRMSIIDIDNEKESNIEITRHAVDNNINKRNKIYASHHR